MKGSAPTETKLVPTAVRPLPNQWMRGPASIPVRIAPVGIAAIAKPNSVLFNPSWVLITGNHGTTFV